MNRPFYGDILLVGEGDFSLSVSLLSCVPQNLWRNITSTSLESETTIQKHKNASENIHLLTRHGRYLYPSIKKGNVKRFFAIKYQRFPFLWTYFVYIFLPLYSRTCYLVMASCKNVEQTELSDSIMLSGAP